MGASWQRVPEFRQELNALYLLFCQRQGLNPARGRFQFNVAGNVETSKVLSGRRLTLEERSIEIMLRNLHEDIPPHLTREEVVEWRARLRYARVATLVLAFLGNVDPHAYPSEEAVLRVLAAINIAGSDQGPDDLEILRFAAGGGYDDSRYERFMRLLEPNLPPGYQRLSMLPMPHRTREKMWPRLETEVLARLRRKFDGGYGEADRRSEESMALIARARQPASPLTDSERGALLQEAERQHDLALAVWGVTLA